MSNPENKEGRDGPGRERRDPGAGRDPREHRDGRDGRDARDGDDEFRLRERLEKLLPEVVRRAISAGSTALLTTEDGIRRLVSEMNLPRELAAYLVMQASASKDEVLRIISQEIRRFLESVNLSGELQKLLTSLSFEIKTEIRFIPNQDAIVKPEVRNKVSVKRGRDRDSDPGREGRDRDDES